MAIAELPRESLRPERDDLSRLAWAFGISCAVHLLLFGGYWGGRKLNIWDRLHLPAWLTPVARLAQALEKKKELPKEQKTPPTLVFVDVSASQATAEPPKDAKYYSDRNSIAANPKADDDTDKPKIEGRQVHVVKNETIEPDKFLPLQPAPPSPKAPAGKETSTPSPPTPPPKSGPSHADTKSQTPSQSPKPKAAQAPGDLAMAKPAPPTPDEGKTDDAPPPPPRPRTVKEALAQLGSDRVPGEKMRQTGGVPRQAIEPGFDVAASPFGAYDRALIQAVSQRWFSLLDARDYVSDSRGKVVVQFRLHYDGRVTDVSVSENTAGEMMGLICQKALVDPAPFPVWPTDMRRMLGDTRNIQFTFYYE